tara:strand:+ start:378 stop:635 length:258 start_codon:yes stop_codon:yes gene_type:complete
VSNFHFNKVNDVLNASEVLQFHPAAIDKNWTALVLWIWPAFAAPGALFTILPKSIVLVVADKKIANWCGMSVVFAGSLAAAFDLA